MKTVVITKNQFLKMAKYRLSKSVTSIESNLYLLNKQNNLKRQLLKMYKKTSGEYFGNKLLTINSLIDNKKNINIKELVFPNKLAVIDKIVVGFTMDLIENNTNLEVLLKNQKIKTTEKIKYLKQVAKIISKIQHCKCRDLNFYLADIHESNFILNHDNNKIMCVDLDGCKINNNKIYSTKYGSFNEKLYNLEPKYNLDENDNFVPNNNTEWYCYSMMMLNMIGNGSIYKLMIQDYYDYIQYLKDANFSSEIIDYFLNIYSLKENYSPVELLNQIPSDLSKVNYNSFIKKKNIERFYK